MAMPITSYLALCKDAPEITSKTVLTQGEAIDAYSLPDLQ